MHKKIVTCILSLALFLQILVSAGFAAPNVPIGDVSGDNTVNVGDYTMMRRYILNLIHDFPVADDMWVGDLNGDGSINSGDYTLLRRFLLGLIDKFPKESQIIPTSTPPAPTQTPPVTKDDRHFPAGLSKSELLSRATSMSVSEQKAIIKKQVDEHWDVITSICGFKNKEAGYAFFFGMATRESTFRAATETGSASAHAIGPLQTAETAYANANPDYMPETNVPEMFQYDFGTETFYDVGYNVHMGIRHFLHFARLAKEKYSGKDISRHGLMGYNTGWIDGSDENWIKRYADETAALGGWYLKNNHMSDNEFTWDTDPRVDRSNPWGYLIN